jgi:AcrR family transcriptional regulator
VSRSTFYTHYRDKNDLLLTDAEEFLEGMATALSRFGDKSERLAPVHEFFTHIGEMGPYYKALNDSGRMQDMMQLGQQHFARGIEQRLNEMPRARNIPPDRRGTVAHAFAGSLFGLLNWWIQHRMPLPAEEMDKLFHRLVWTGADGS